MLTYATLKDQTVTLRGTLIRLLESEADKADRIPNGWKNNLRWHAGHMVVTPRLLTFGLMGEPLGVPDEYRKWFGKGSSPFEWGDATIPSFEQLVTEIKERTEPLFDTFESRQDEAFPKPYETSAGVTLTTPAEALNFSLAHDGIHIGLILALKRALK